MTLEDLRQDSAKCFTLKLEVDYYENFSLVILCITIRIMLVITFYNNWELDQLAVKKNFINELLHRDIYMSQLEGYVKDLNKVCLPKR